MRLVTFRDSPHSTRVGELDGGQVHGCAAETMIEWLSGEGHVRTGSVHPLSDLHLLAPVPTPPSVRDFFAFEEHVAAGWKLRGAEIPEAWYDAPVFYFSNPAGICGPGDEVARPTNCNMLDFELEIAAVIGTDNEIAGFTLMNDWSARDLQIKEMTVGLGPAKGKDFATSLGPMLVTPDELPYEDGRLHLEATVTVNGEEVTPQRRLQAALHMAADRRAGRARHGAEARRRARLRNARQGLPAGARPARGRALARARRPGRARRAGDRDAREPGRLRTVSEVVARH